MCVFFACLNDLLDEVRRDEMNAFAIPEDQIAGHHGGCSNAYRDVDPGEHHVTVGSRRRAAEVASGIEVNHAAEVADRAIDYKSGPGSCVNCGMKIVSAKGPVGYFAK